MQTSDAKKENEKETETSDHMSAAIEEILDGAAKYAVVRPDPLTEKERACIIEELDDVFRRVDEVVRKQHAADKRERAAGVGALTAVDTHTCLVPDQQVRDRLMAVDGLIGAGKTTLCRCLIEFMRVQQPEKTHKVVMEPVLSEALDMFYADPDAMAERFQLLQACLCVSSARLALIETGLQGGGAPGTTLLDRSPLGNLSFALVHHLAGRIPKDGFKLYKASLCSAGIICMPRTVHLCVSPPVAAARILWRHQKTDPDRACEKGIPLDYLQKLDAVMMMVSAYVAASGRAQVQFVDWNRFGSTQSVLETKPAKIDMEQLRKVKTHRELLQLIGFGPNGMYSFDS